MHLCFAPPWRTSWIPLCYVFSMLKTNLNLSSALLFMIFYLCTCYVATWLLSYIARIVSCMLMFRVLWSQPQCFYLRWSSLCWQQSPKKLCCYHLPTRGRVWVKLGMLIHCKCIYNFDAPCLIYTISYILSLHFVVF